MSETSKLPWTWHAKSKDQAHNGSIYRWDRPGHAYAIAMQPQYVEDEQFNADAAFIVRAVNNHDVLVKALEKIAAIENREFGLDWEEIEEARHIARAALASAKEES